MADGTTYDIRVQAESLGVDASAEQVNQLAASLQETAAVSTQFDSAIAAARTQLSAASEVASASASALSAAEAKYSQLERSANIAARAVEKAALAGKDTAALQARADEAAAALQAQAAAVDDARAAATEAAAAEKKLAESLKTLEKAAKDAAKETDDVGDSFSLADIKAGELGGAMGQLGGPFGKISQSGLMVTDSLQKVAGALGPMGAAAVAGAVAFVALGSAAVYAYAKLAIFAVTSNKEAMERLNKATEGLKTNLGKLFTGVPVSKFVDSFEDVLSIFEEGTATSNALKTLIETMLTPLFDSAPQAAAIVKAAFKGMVLGAIEIAIAAVRVRNAVLRLIPKEVRQDLSELVSGIDQTKTAMYAGAAIAIVLAVAFGVLAVAVAILAAILITSMVISIMILIAPFLLLIAIVMLVVYAIEELPGAIGAAVDWLLGLGEAGVQAAADMISGLVNGIKSGAGAFVDAVRNLAQSAIGALKSTLGIASPSKVFAELGVNTTMGFARGVDDSAPEAQSALESMVSPEDAAKAGQVEPTQVSNTTSSGGNTFYVTVNGGGTAEDNVSAFEAWFVARMNAEALAVGGAG